MIDLHCHLLPDVDDGPDSLEESLAMARMARADGIRTVVVTPHARHWEQRHRAEDSGGGLEAAVQQLQEQLREAGIDLALVPGMEVDLDETLPLRLLEGRASPLGRGPYVLLELPFLAFARYIDRAIFHAQVAGWQPILAHVERYVYFQERPELLEPLVRRGVLTQVNAGSLTGELGEVVRGTAMRLLRRGLVHCLATDAHGASGARVPLLSPAVAIAARCVGQARAQAMVEAVPDCILTGKREEEIRGILMLC